MKHVYNHGHLWPTLPSCRWYTSYSTHIKLHSKIPIMRPQALTQLLPLLSSNSLVERQTNYTSPCLLLGGDITIQAFETYMTADTKAPSYVIFTIPDIKAANGNNFICNRTLYSLPREPVITLQMTTAIPCTELPATLGAPLSGLMVYFLYTENSLAIQETFACPMWVAW